MSGMPTRALKVPSLDSPCRYKDVGIYNLQEVDIMCRLHHPHLLHIDELVFHRDQSSQTITTATALEQFAYRGPFALLMPFYPSTLFKNVRRYSYFAEIVRIVYQLASAVDFLHKQNILHLDVTLTNVLMDEQDNVHLADFGAAKMVNHPEGKLSSSYRSYMPWVCRPPENLNGEKKYVYSKATDVWGIGTILFCLVCKEELICPKDHENNDETRIHKFYQEWIEGKCYEKVMTNLWISEGSEQVGQVIDLVAKTLTLNAETRISLPELLAHPLFDNCRSSQGRTHQPEEKRRERGEGRKERERKRKRKEKRKREKKRRGK